MGCAPKIPVSRPISARRDAEELLFPVEVDPARGQPDQPGRTGKGGGQEKADDWEYTVEAVEAPTRWMVARPRLPVVMAAAPKPPKKVVPQ